MKPSTTTDSSFLPFRPYGKSADKPTRQQSAASGSARFYRNHFLLPIVIAVGLGAMLIVLHADFWVADRLYELQGNAWSLKSHFLTESVVHVGGRAASAIAWLIVAAASVRSCLDDRLFHWRRPLAYLAVTTLAAVSVVAGIKQFSGMDCAWDLARYGGDRPFVSLLQPRPDTLPAAGCFPAGHASAGYAWLTLYFFCLATTPRFRWIGLCLALGLGVTFGFAQQLRGAHFVSHDLWALMICWLVALAGYIAFFHGSTATTSHARVACQASIEAGR